MRKVRVVSPLSWHCCALLSLIGLVLLSGNVAQAALVYWNNSGTGNWTDPSWVTMVPGSGDTAYIGLGGTVELDSTASVAAVLLGHSSSPYAGSGTLNIKTGADLTTSGHVYVKTHSGYSGTVNHSGGSLTIGGSLLVENNAGAGSGHYTLDGGVLTFDNSTETNRNLNLERSGTFDYISGSINGRPIVRVGNVTGAFKSVFNLHGNALDVQGVRVGEGGSEADEFNFQGGTVTAGYFLVGGSTAPADPFDSTQVGTIVTLGHDEKLSTTAFLYVGETGSVAATFNHEGSGDSHLKIGNGLRLSNGGGTQRDYFNQISGTMEFTSPTLAGGARVLNIIGEGTFNFIGGDITGLPNVHVGSSSGDFKSIFNLGGNTLNANEVRVGGGGGGQADEFHFQGGRVNTTTLFLVGGSTAPADPFDPTQVGTIVTLGQNERLDIGTHLYVGETNDMHATFNHEGSGSSFLKIGNNLYLSKHVGNQRDYFNQKSGTIEFLSTTVDNTNRVLDIRADGTFNFIGGAITGVPNVHVGTASGAFTSVFNLGGNTLNAHEVRIGGGLSSVPDEFNFQGGKVTTATSFLVGGSTNAEGTTITLDADAELTTALSLFVGYQNEAIGNFQVSGGTLQIGDDLFVAYGGGNQRDYFRLNSGSVSFTGGANSNVDIMREGTVSVQGGTMSGLQNLLIGSTGGGAAIYEQGAGVVTLNGAITLAGNSTMTGELKMSGGSLTMLSPTSDLNFNFNSSAQISGGTLNVGRHMNIGNVNTYTAQVEQTGGEVNVPGNVHLAAVNGSTASYELSGGTLRVGGDLKIAAVGSGSSGTFNLNGGSLDVLGTLDLTGNPGTDAFNFSAGKLSAATVDNQEGLLNYTGGVISPGLFNTAVTMTISGSLFMPDGGGLEVDLATPDTYGDTNDLLIVTGNLGLNGILTINNINDLEGTFPIIQFNGNLSGPGLTSLTPTLHSIFVELNDLGGGTVFVTITAPAEAIPEPASLLLLALGLVGLKRPRRQAVRAKSNSNLQAS